MAVCGGNLKRCTTTAFRISVLGIYVGATVKQKLYRCLMPSSGCRVKSHASFILAPLVNAGAMFEKKLHHRIMACFSRLVKSRVSKMKALRCTVGATFQ
ncbi:hypothetical protein QQX98_013232 [Neonectria punicea]|uniref:Uncharacterized protein n=1 Tax=Neonectria punicea TaxID=979145 RepID=A0ABR1GGW1_9HYPO